MGCCPSSAKSGANAMNGARSRYATAAMAVSAIATASGAPAFAASAMPPPTRNMAASIIAVMSRVARI